jgi:hypothetical protein
MGRTEEVRVTADTDTEEKSAYDLLRNAHVAELAERFKPIQRALEAM